MAQELSAIQDCDLDGIISETENDCSGFGLKAVNLFYKLAYLDMSHGADVRLCYLLISNYPSNGVSNGSTEELEASEETKSVLTILQNHKLIQEKQEKNPNCSKSFQILPSIQQKLSIRNQKNVSVIIDLTDILLKFWIDVNTDHWLIPMTHIFHIHKSLKDLNWPEETIKWSVYFAVQQLIDGYHMEMGLEILVDVETFLKTVNSSKSAKVNEAYWLAIQMIRVHNDVIMKSRKLLQPSDTISVGSINGVARDIRLDNYGSWILSQIHVYMDSELDCDALILVAEATLERLRKHARFCSQPDELTLNWLISYKDRNWHEFHCFAALACFPPTDEWLEKMCRTYIKKLFEKMQLDENSNSSLLNVYASWVCLRDLVKTSRIRDQMISALTDEEGLQFLFLNFERCENRLESKEYFLKYQSQTVIEMLTPLIVHGKSEDVKNLVKSEKFWNLVKLVLIKHPFINERYDIKLENDLLCACEVYLDLLVAVCNRNDAISSEIFRSFLSQDFLETFIVVLEAAQGLLNSRQRHTCEFYLFTILFTILHNVKEVELVDLYFKIEVVQIEIEEISQESFIFEVPAGCLRDYRVHLKSFIEFYKIQETTTIPNLQMKSIENLVLNMIKVPEKYDWESDGDENTVT